MDRLDTVSSLSYLQSDLSSQTWEMICGYLCTATAHYTLTVLLNEAVRGNTDSIRLQISWHPTSSWGRMII